MSYRCSSDSPYVEDEDETCDPRVEADATLRCGLMLNDPRFQQCHALVPPDDFFGACKFDYCAGNGDENDVCSALETYAARCRDMGVVVDWRAVGDCRKCSIPPWNRMINLPFQKWPSNQCITYNSYCYSRCGLWSQCQFPG